MIYSCIVSQPGCHVVYLRDSFGRLLQIYAAKNPDDFRIPAARLVAKLAMS